MTIDELKKLGFKRFEIHDELDDPKDRHCYELHLENLNICISTGIIEKDNWKECMITDNEGNHQVF